MNEVLNPRLLPEGVRSRFIDNVNGLRMHVLESGHADGARPCVVLLHGFPELAYCWRHTLTTLADAGFHVIAPDMRGYGRTTGWQQGYDIDLRTFGMMNLVTDVVGLVRALGYQHVHAVVGHDYGSPVAAYAALIRPDIFRSVALMASPFPGIPPAPADNTQYTGTVPDVPALLAALKPPRKHYQHYFSTREAAPDMEQAPQGMHAFFRAYYHYKSADCPLDPPFRLSGWVAEELAKMPTYYIMDADQGMAASVAPYMPDREHIAANSWLTEEDLAFCANEYSRTGFQGGLNWYRCDIEGLNAREMQIFSGRTIDVPACFISGESDWCAYQKPGHLEAMCKHAATRWAGTHFVQGAGHWVHQEQADETSRLLLQFFASHSH